MDAIKVLQWELRDLVAAMDDGGPDMEGYQDAVAYKLDLEHKIRLLTIANEYGVEDAIKVLEAGRVEWKPDDGITTILTRFDEAVDPVLRQASQFKNDWIWQERKRAIEIARALLAALPEPK